MAAIGRQFIRLLRSTEDNVLSALIRLDDSADIGPLVSGVNSRGVRKQLGTHVQIAAIALTSELA